MTLYDGLFWLEEIQMTGELSEKENEVFMWLWPPSQQIVLVKVVSRAENGNIVSAEMSSLIAVRVIAKK